MPEEEEDIETIDFDEATFPPAFAAFAALKLMDWNGRDAEPVTEMVKVLATQLIAQGRTAVSVLKLLRDTLDEYEVMVAGRPRKGRKKNG